MDFLTRIERADFVTWGTALGIGIVFYFASTLIRNLIVSKIEVRAKMTETIIDDIIVDSLKTLKRWFFLALSVYVGLVCVNLKDKYQIVADKSFILLALFQFAQIAGTIINSYIAQQLKKRTENNVEMASTFGLITLALKFIAYSLILLLALHNVGVNITALIAGLGVGGIAVALALQNILTDLFSSLTIILDKPFQAGDFIVVGDMMGTVEHIGLKTTRVRSLSGEQLVFGNGDLLQSRIKNYKRMNERRIVQKLTVTYQTPEEKLARIPEIVRAIVEKVDLVRYDRCHFLNFGDSALEYELVYWVGSREFNEYAERAQRINIAVFKAFNAEGIDFAYPTRTIHMAGKN
jgi:small-conductance mechanosensitive channel